MLLNRTHSPFEEAHVVIRRRKCCLTNFFLHSLISAVLSFHICCLPYDFTNCCLVFFVLDQLVKLNFRKFYCHSGALKHQDTNIVSCF